MATTTFTNATDYGPDDDLNSSVTITGITVSAVTNIRLEIDWNPDGDCGGDAQGGECTVYSPGDEAYYGMFSGYSQSGTDARTNTYDITSSFPSGLNGAWRFNLQDYDMTGCFQITETRIIVTYTAAATTTNAPFLMFVD
tara:strand:- start:446 stop:865 length:420 start_codon:yes stop_codon:yes gene_type:complete